MNYVRELNAFYDWLESNPCSTGTVALWFILMAVNNKAGWKQEFTVANLTLQAKTGLSRKQLDRCRQSLIDRKRIQYRKSNKVNEAGIYRMVTFDARDDTPQDTPYEPRDDTRDDHRMTHGTGTLVKQDKTKQKLMMSSAPEDDERAIEDQMKLRTNNFQYRLVANDYQAYQKLRDEGVPLQFILEGIDESFDNYEPKHALDSVTKFNYCAKRILGRWTDMQSRQTAGGGRVEYPARRSSVRGQVTATASRTKRIVPSDQFGRID